MKFYTTLSANTQAFSLARQKAQEHPLDPAAHLAVAGWFVRTGIYPKAIMEYKRVLELRPADSAAKAGLRKALLAAKRRTEALALR